MKSAGTTSTQTRQLIEPALLANYYTSHLMLYSTVRPAVNEACSCIAHAPHSLENTLFGKKTASSFDTLQCLLLIRYEHPSFGLFDHLLSITTI